MTVSLEDLEREVQELGFLVYSEQVKSSVEELLSKIPNPDVQTQADAKIRLYLLRARARLLLPIFSKEAEQDINRALKLNQSAPLSWVVLSEAYWRRNALREARDALDSALRVDPKFQPALAQYSRILRSMCGAADIPAQEKLALLTEAEAKAKEAVAVNPADGDSWSALAVTILQLAVANGMELPLLKKALASLTQAVQKSPRNPDVYYNRGVVHSAFGHFGSAIADFVKAYELDPKGLKFAKANAEKSLAMLQKIRSKTSAGFAGMNERDFKKNVASKLPAPGKDGDQTFVQIADVLDKDMAKGSTTAVQWVAVKVVDLLSGASDQPLIYLVVDRDGVSSALLCYRVSVGALKIGDTVMIPFPPSSAATLGHSVSESPVLESTAEQFAIPTILVEPTTLIVNGGPIPAKFFKMPELGTRQFQ